MEQQITNRIADNVRKHRLAQNLTQEKLAELASLHHNYIGLVERGQTHITVIALGQIAQALGLELIELLKDK